MLGSPSPHLGDGSAADDPVRVPLQAIPVIPVSTSDPDEQEQS